ncbi:MAG TPA: rhodanese-like domain-containing protein [Vicinamibacterales bacterium]|nr:rhodanese-like domain-containing protein [Vicinamibacterales bacterium]
MIVSRFYEPTIAQASYLIGCAATGEAIVIDPNRDVERYIEDAAREGLSIAHVTETHIHADFLSGARELARRTGAHLYLSDEGDQDWKYQFASEARLVRHGDRITVGRILIDVVATPGHTPEHIAFLVTDGAAADKPIAAATGDFIFVGDVGRPDLLERAANIKGTMEKSARTLWGSLQAFNRNEEWLQIWPGHGAGSACGKGISAVPYSTLGYERRFNWAFKVKTEEQFVAAVLEGQPEPPTYFATMKYLNKAGPAILGGFHAPPRLDERKLADLLASQAIVVDTRSSGEYAAEHLPGTLNIPLNRSFITWAGWLLPYSADLYFIVDELSEANTVELVRQLALIGLDRVAGVFEARAVQRAAERGAALGTVRQITAGELSARLTARDVTIVDVRGATEWRDGHIANALHIPLGYLADRLDDVPTDRMVVLHCQTGARSAIAASMLRRAGRTDVANLAGGMAWWQGAGLPVARPAVA